MENTCCDTNGSCGCDCGGSRDSKLCELTEPHNSFDMEKIIPLVDSPKFICRCCGRLANDEESLCNPLPLINTK